MKGPRYEDLFENWEIGVAKNIIREFKGQWGVLKVEEDEDLLQECLSQWIFSKNKYDPGEGASRSTYMARIVRTKLQSIVRGLNRDNRKILQNSISLDEPLCNGDDGSFMFEVLPDRTDCHGTAELKITLSQIIAKLTPLQQKLCEMILSGESSIADISRELGVCRVTVYREMERIRDAFEQEK